MVYVSFEKTKCNAAIRWNGHPTKSLELSKHPQNNIDVDYYFMDYYLKTIFYMIIISNDLKNAKTRKNLEASYIALWKPDLNKPKDFERLVLFRNAVTYSN